ncbi:MAG: molybdate ABC transporter substrate-binding protein [Phormidesmis sp.]
MKRRQFIPPFLVGLLSSWLLSACTGLPLAATGEPLTEPTAPITLTVSAAASLQDALEAIAPQFSEAYPNIAVDYNFASSGSLQQQIEQGAPADIFFSAGTQQMDTLEEKALIASESRQDVITNRLVLISPITDQQEIANLAQLKTASISRFAVGEFRSVPAGRYAQQVFEQLGLLALLEDKFVFGNNVRNVLAAVESGNAELGMVYATDAALSEQVKVLVTVPESTHSPIVYPAAVLNNTANAKAAQTWIDFLTTESAQSTFEAFSFGRV